MQNVNLFTVTPLNYEVSLHAMSHEKLALKIVASLTIGPRESEPKELQKVRYSNLEFMSFWAT